jgi:uncharacterized protein YkwD
MITLRTTLLIASLAAGLAACAPIDPPQLGADGRPLPQLYRISAAQAPQVQGRLLDSVNALRQASGAQPVRLNDSLNAAAAMHARDMARQNRPWNFGSDGSTPIDRARRAGYTGQFKGQAISESYETELETLGAWMQTPDTRSIILDPTARDLGVSFYQESNGKIWWTLVTGG